MKKSFKMWLAYGPRYHLRKSGSSRAPVPRFSATIGMWTTGVFTLRDEWRDWPRPGHTTEYNPKNESYQTKNWQIWTWHAQAQKPIPSIPRNWALDAVAYPFQGMKTINTSFIFKAQHARLTQSFIHSFIQSLSSLLYCFEQNTCSVLGIHCSLSQITNYYYPLLFLLRGQYYPLLINPIKRLFQEHSNLSYYFPNSRTVLTPTHNNIEFFSSQSFETFISGRPLPTLKSLLYAISIYIPRN